MIFMAIKITETSRGGKSDISKSNHGISRSIMAKILFVDDDTQTLALMEREAEILGHVAFLCPTAREAVNYALETQTGSGA